MDILEKDVDDWELCSLALALINIVSTLLCTGSGLLDYQKCLLLCNAGAINELLLLNKTFLKNPFNKKCLQDLTYYCMGSNCCLTVLQQIGNDVVHAIFMNCGLGPHSHVVRIGY